MSNPASQVSAARAFNKSMGLSMAKAIVRPDGPLRVRPNELLTLGKTLRDGKIWQYPIMGEAILVFQQLAATREWSVSGKPLAVSRAVDFINSAETVDVTTGYVEYGFEQFLRRRVMDYLIIGRTTYAVRPGDKPVMEYIDPTLLRFGRGDMFHGVSFPSALKPVKPTDVVWHYVNDRRFRANEIVLSHPFPIGTNLFISAVVNLLPVATLSWLQREHDTASLDGRKMRDIFLVGSSSIQSAIQEAIEMTVALHAGADPKDVGVPVVEVNNHTGKPITDQFAKLGLSTIPDAFSREEFTFTYVNEIAAALGLALRHFWNNEKTTNRALEVVQEQRQQQKGPSTFVRTEQRLLNNSGVLQQFDKSGNPVRFAFKEETDVSSLTAKAEAMDKMTAALERMATVFNVNISMEDWLSWMQSEDLLPPEMQILEGEQANTLHETDGGMNAEGEETQESDPSPTTATEVKSLRTEEPLGYDEITMSGDGKVVSRRRKIFHFSKVLKSEIETSWKESMLLEEDADVTEAESLFAKAVAEAKIDSSIAAFKKFYQEEPDRVDKFCKSGDVEKDSMAEEVVDLGLRNIILPKRLHPTLLDMVKTISDSAGDGGE